MNIIVHMRLKFQSRCYPLQPQVAKLKRKLKLSGSIKEVTGYDPGYVIRLMKVFSLVISTYKLTFYATPDGLLLL